MRWLGWHLRLDPKPNGFVDGECPYCASVVQMRKHRVLPRWAGAVVLFPSNELVVCTRCRGVARDESMLDRIMSALFLVPFLLVLGGGTTTGAYLLFAMARDGNPSAAWVAIAVGLVAVGGYAGWRALRAFRRLLTPRRMLPLAGWGTDL